MSRVSVQLNVTGFGSRQMAAKRGSRLQAVLSLRICHGYLEV